MQYVVSFWAMKAYYEAGSAAASASHSDQLENNTQRKQQSFINSKALHVLTKSHC